MSQNDTAAQPLPEKMKQHLLKVRKGATSGFGTKDWETVLKHFGLGFTVQKAKDGEDKGKIVKVLVTAPNGAVLEVVKFPHYSRIVFYGIDVGEKSYTIPSWLKEQDCDLVALASRALGMATPDEERAEKEYKARDWTNTGTCGVCEGNFKMAAGQKLVHHGYLRPGDGMIHGDCPGVGFKPHELSPEAAQNYLTRGLKPHLASQQQFLADLREGKVLKLMTRKPSHLNNHTAQYVEKGQVGWDRRLEQEIYSTESAIKNTQEEVERFTKKVADWKLDELPEVKKAQEQQARERAWGKLA